MSRDVSIQLGDETHRLRYGWNAVVRVEESLGKRFAHVDVESFRDLRVLVWAGLLHERRNLSLSQVGDMLDAALRDGRSGMEMLGEKVMGALVEGGIMPAPVSTHDMTVAEIEAEVDEWGEYELRTAFESEQNHPEHEGGRKGALKALRGALGNAMGVAGSPSV